MLRNKGGFTLIELVMIIVILGILAAVAIPRYIDLKDDADKANARGIVGGLNSASSIAFARLLISPNAARCTQGAASLIDTAAELEGCMDGGLPENWSSASGNFVYTAGVGSRTFNFVAETSTSKAYVQTTSTTPGWPY